MPKYNRFFGGGSHVRSVWWAFIIALGYGQSAWAQSSQPGSVDLRPADNLQVTSKLQTHVLEEDQMSAFMIADDVHRRRGSCGAVGECRGATHRHGCKGDRIDYLRSTGQLRVRGDGLIMRDASIIRAPAFDYNIDAESGEISEPDFWLGATGGSGDAGRADIFQP